MKHYYLLAAALSTLCAAGRAEIKLPEQFSDHAVLQQNADAAIWGWANPGATVAIKPSWAPSPTETKAGADGFWRTAIPTPSGGYTPYEISVTDLSDNSTATLRDILVGEVWIASGQSNMEMPIRGNWARSVEGAADAIAHAGNWSNRIRIATVPKQMADTPQPTTKGRWIVPSSDNAPWLSALAYFYAQELNSILDVPVGIICAAYGGSRVESWLPARILDSYPEDWRQENHTKWGEKEWMRANLMYNGMLYPLAGYTAKGFIWNQGESNVGSHETFPARMADMVGEMRSLWGDSDARMPFYQVEIPGYSYGNPEGIDAALLREAQHRSTQLIPNCGIIVTSDLNHPYEVEEIHGCMKKPIGVRMARQAAARTYGMASIPWQFPTLEKAELTDSGKAALLSFANAPGGFLPCDGTASGFEAAGADGVFKPAQVVEDWTTHQLRLTAPGIDSIREIRYCFKNFCPGRFYNDIGMPVTPFRHKF